LTDGGGDGPPHPAPPTPAESPVEPPALASPAATNPDGPVAPLAEIAHPYAPDASRALRDAVGPPSQTRRPPVPDDDDDDLDGRPRSKRRLYTIVAAVVAAALAIATLSFLGVANSSRYLLVCTADRAEAEQGRAFPPWGTRALTGAEWKPVPLPATAECKPRETDELHDLEGWYLDALLDRTSATLAQRDLLAALPSAPSTALATSPLDVAAAQLDQAQLLARTPDRRDQRKDIERLRGDVEYWRAMLRLRDSAATLLDASKQLDDAANHRPKHATDAAAWARFVRDLGGTLSAGPNAAAATTNAAGSSASEPVMIGPPRPAAPQGSALPVEPEQPDVVPIDAGVPSGGVLL
jgi:hypothetical protein